MERFAFPRAAAAGLLAVLCAFGAVQPVSAQVGHVVKAQKISSTSGGFSALLEELDQFGRSIVNLGDMDGDGVTDLMVGAHTDDDGGLDKGAIYILFMHDIGFVKEWRKISDLEGNFSGRLRKGDQFGRAAACLGDLDGDGVLDLAVSSNYDDDGGTNKGAVYILFLNADATVKSSQKISATQGGLPANLSIHDEFGRSITNLGDLDGDGVVDILVGTPEDDEGGTNTGALHVLFLNTNGTVKSYKRISKNSAGLAIKPTDWFGFSSANLGDFDGDGVTDVVVGAVLDDDGGVNQGSIWILFLNPDGSVKAKREIDELEGGFTVQMDDIDQFGTSVANMGDLDGDGVTDIAVGAVKDDDGGTPGFVDADVGAVYVLFMNPDASVKSWTKISDLVGDLPYSLDQWDWFGSALAPYGGSSGDGLFNAVIGCRNDDDAGGNQGAIYMVQINDGTVPSANFSASKTRGIAPLTVSFSDASAGEVTAWLWNFGDGPLSSQRAPTKTYDLPGAYDVQFTVRGPGGIDVETKRNHITVTAGVLAEFDATPRAGPCPLTVGFGDLSEGNVTTWSWDFGDGTTSSARFPSHVYADCGNYAVSLTVSGPQGTDTLTRSDFVVVALLPPQASFTASPTAGEAPLDVQFLDATTGDVTSWSWDFGDGYTSVQRNPLHRYDVEGLYSVSLIARGPGGSDTRFEFDLVAVGVAPPVASFDATPTVGPEPLTVVFSDLTTGVVTSWAWSFGDGGTASEQNPVHVYTVPGVYGVTLTASGPGGTNTLVRPGLITVAVAPPGAAFSATPTTGTAPLGVQFTDLSTSGPTGWSWSFGDGTTSNLQHPAHVYANPGRYSVTLLVNGPGGSDTLALTDLITVDVPPTTADFTAEPVSGPAPLLVGFNNASSANVTAWAWNFGDGATSSATSPTHVYALPGTYSVSLTVQSPTGTGSRVYTNLVTAYEAPPEALFSALPGVGGVPLVVQFADQSTGNISAWSWDFGDSASASVANPVHTYGAPGAFTVSLTVTGPGGSSTLTQVDAILVGEGAPVAAFGAAPVAGMAPLAVQFSDMSTGVVSVWSWSFGDGTSASTRNPGHTYTNGGIYTVTLTARGPGGADGETKTALITVTEPPPTADFTAAPTAGFAPLAVQFTNASTGTVTSWNWDFGDGASSNGPNPTHVYATSASYTVTLTVTGPGGSDVAARSGFVQVSTPPPVADFAGSPRDGYAPLLVTFTDLSTGEVTQRSWSFGDGQASSERDPLHEFVAPGSYVVALEVSGPGGTSARRRTVVVREPPIFGDGSFEAQVVGVRPGPPWTVFNGTSVFVRSSAKAGDQGFPSSGAKWCDLGADGTSSARPPSNPRGAGQPATGTAGIQQAFLFPHPTPHLFFEAAFLLNGAQRTVARNDFMSVDLSDGVTVWNLFHADSFSEFPLVSSRTRLAMTALERVHADLAALFPTADENTVLTLRIGTGNVGGAVAPSRGYVDALRFAPDATATFRNGQGKNPAFYRSSPAELGGDWTFDVDASRMPGTRMVVVTCRQRALAGLPGIGGEVLIGGPTLLTLILPSSGGLDHFVLPMPDDPAMIGQLMATQAMLVGKTYKLGNAYDLRMGY